MKSPTSNSANPFVGVYPWDYLKPEHSDRPAILESMIGPYIKERDIVFDILCGFSPISGFLLRKACHVVGFDISAEAIEYCTQAYPGGSYYVADDGRVEIPERVDVLIHLGINPGTDPWGLESRTEVKTSIRTILKAVPRIVVLEAAVEFSAGYKGLKTLVASEAYDLQEEVTYEFHAHVGSVNPGAATACKRVLSIFRRRSSGPLRGRSFCSLSDETLTRFFTDLNPFAQAESLADRNLGFGFLYYAIGRIVRPKLALVLGSQRGFSAISIALAIRDNGNSGKLVLVDAAYDDVADGIDRGFGGTGFWKDSESVRRMLERFGVADAMEVKVMRTAEFAQLYKAQRMPVIDLLLIDADHSYRGFKGDFETYKKFVADDGLILCHDTEVEDGLLSYQFGVRRYLRNVIRQDRHYEAMSLPVWPGLGIIRKLGPVRGAPQREGEDGSVLWRSIRTLYHWMPLPKAARLRLKDGLYTVLGRIFPSSSWCRRYVESQRRDPKK